MATSDSDDFESADEELEFHSDNDYCPNDVKNESWSSEILIGLGETAVERGKNLSQELKELEEVNKLRGEDGEVRNDKKDDATDVLSKKDSDSCLLREEENGSADRGEMTPSGVEDVPSEGAEREMSSVSSKKRPERQRKDKPGKPSGFGAKKLGVRVSEAPRAEEIKEPPIIQECWELGDDEAAKILQKSSDSWNENADLDEVPEELKSNKSFKEVFKSDGWESFGDEEKILRELGEEEEAVKAVAEKSDRGWGSWGSWGVSSLINTASAGVSTLTSHVSQGLSLLEESMGVPDPQELVGTPEQAAAIDEKSEPAGESESSGFGIGSWMSGMSSITKLVETTGTKVITGGLGTLETIGKKTMEVLQEGDPGLKKKRAFFLNEGEKPILSQMLREAKEKADEEERTVEEKQLARKVHFETLFDDFQGLVHLEALEMLSKQSNIKIQRMMVALEPDDMLSAQETLNEVKELCDLGEEDEEDDEEGDLKEKLEAACSDLGVSINYDKLNEIWDETKTYLADVAKPESTISDREIFQDAISSLAKFTAYSVERFHKTAELLLVKERRRTVNEADALVQLTKILSGQIGTIASAFSKCLNDKSEGKTENSDITTIFLEATNASSYIQDAFRLLIPILQVGTL